MYGELIPKLVKTSSSIFGTTNIALDLHDDEAFVVVNPLYASLVLAPLP